MNTEFLLISGGCGCLETALHLRKLVAKTPITIVNLQPFLIYQPWLIKILIMGLFYTLILTKS